MKFKKAISLLLCIAIVLSTAATATGAIFYGDVDGNGTIELADAEKLYDYFNGIEEDLGLEGEKAADISKDDKLTLRDAMMLFDICNDPDYPKVPAEPEWEIVPLNVSRELKNVASVGTVEAYGDYWTEGKDVTEDLTDHPELAYSLIVSDITEFAGLPEGYDREKLLEWGKAPGLNMDILHEQGFTGKGAVIAYVDQPASAHEQYAGNNFHFVNNTDNESSMHGPAVLSLLAGKDIGTAPEAEVYFYGHAAWEADQTTHAECLYQIIEQNKKLPEGKKITMVGFSDNIDGSEKNPEAFEAAVAACEEAGIMVWFCGEYNAASFLPMSDKNNPQNLVPERWVSTNYGNKIFVPSAGRTSAANIIGANYIYWATGGLSWTMPYVLGVYSIAIEIDPTLTQTEIRTLLKETAYKNGDMNIINPVGFVAEVLRGVGRNQDALDLEKAVAARSEYIYAVMDTASMTEEDLTAAENYLANITDATVLVVESGDFSGAQEIYSAIQEDHKERGGIVAGVQIFGTAEAVPAFKIKYKAQMISGVDDGGTLLTDLFYGNLENSAEDLTGNYSVLDHFANNWDIDLVPQYPVARLPLEKGEFAAFFEKYGDFVKETGLKQQELVNFSNPIFASPYHTDDMSAFLKRAETEFDILNVPYRLYANKDGDYPVTTPDVLGNFTAENLSSENERGIAEFIINSHGQWNNIDRCIFVDGEEQRISLINMDTINTVLNSNAYYLDTWTCLNGYGMENNLTTTALNGKCVGMFSATAIISNNGVDREASLAEMKQSNFYYFYYSYLKALSEGESRSEAFFAAQKAYGTALIADSANGIRGEGNYQFNLYNLLGYHNFGVLEPNFTSAIKSEGYIEKEEGNPGEEDPGDVPTTDLELTDGTPVGTEEMVIYSTRNELTDGDVIVHSFTYQDLDNGYRRFKFEFTAPKGFGMSIFSPPMGEYFMLLGDVTTGGREAVTFDLEISDLQAAKTVTIKFYNEDDSEKALVFYKYPEIGTNIGEEEMAVYSVSDELTSGNLTVHSFTYQDLDNGSRRFKLTFTAPEGLGISVFSPPMGEYFMLLGNNTSGEKQTLTFSVNKGDLQAVKSMTVKFFSGDETAWVFYNYPEGGTNIGEEEMAVYSVSDELTSGTFTVHSFTYQDLDNGYRRFKFEFTAPEGFGMSIFSPPMGEYFMLFCNNTSGERETITFDLPKFDLQAAETVTIKFFNDDYSEDAWVFYDYAKGGKPIGTERTAEYRLENELTSGTFTVKSFTYQDLDNDCRRFKLTFTAPKGMRMSIFNPPEGDIIQRLLDSTTTGRQETLTFDIAKTDLQAAKKMVVNFFFDNTNSAGIVYDYAE